MKKRITWILAGALAACLFTGTAFAQEWSREFEGETLTFLDVAPNDVRTSYYEGLFERFYEDTGIEVEYQSVPWDDAADKITVLGASGKLPDVLTTWYGWLGQFTESEWVVPLSGYLGDEVEEFTDVIKDCYWVSEKTRYGDIYTVPDGWMVKGIYVRKDWCEELGIELDPTKDWTWDDYFDLVAKLTDAENSRYGATYRGARGGFDIILTYLQGYTQGATFDEDGKILINRPDLFTKWTDMYKNGYAPEDSINWGFAEMVDNFKGGLTGTLINDSEVAATLIDAMEDDQWMVMPFPVSAEDGICYNTMGAPYAYSLSSFCENPDAAFLLIDYMSAAENQADYCVLTGQIPIRKEAADLDYYSENGYYGPFLWQMNQDNVAIPATYGPFDYTDLHQGLLHEEVQSYLLGDVTAEEAMDTICDALQERMDEYLEENPDTEIEKALFVVK